MSPLSILALVSCICAHGQEAANATESQPGFTGTTTEKIENASSAYAKTDNCTVKMQSVAAARRSATSVSKAATIGFQPLPKNRNYATAVHKVHGINPYSHIKDVLHFIHPSPFPADLFRDTMRENISTPAIALQVLEMELGFVAVLFLSLFLSLVIPAMVLSLCSTTPSPPPTCAPNCKRRTLVFCLQLILSSLLLGSGAMLWANEECSRGVAKMPDFVNNIFKDCQNFFEDHTDKLQHLLTESFEQAAAPANHDLNGIAIALRDLEIICDNRRLVSVSCRTRTTINKEASGQSRDAENLLGRPIQVELVLETGLDAALDSLVEIAAGGKEVCSQVSGILRSTVEAEQLVTVTEGRLKELKDQLDTIKKHCPTMDRPLCDLIPDQILEMKFTTKMITGNSRLTYLKQGGIETLSSSVLEANAIFTGLSSKIDKETKSARLAAANEILRMKTELAKISSAYDIIKTRTSLELYDLKINAKQNMDTVLYLEYWRWLVGLIAGMLVLYIWALITGATCCGCCGSEKSSSPTLIVSLIIVSMVSVCLWILSFMTMYIGGHGETCICETLHEENDFSILSQVIDTLKNYRNESESYLPTVLFKNGSLNMPVGKVLSGCQKNESAYKAFNFHLILDIELLTNVTNWQSVHTQLQDIHVDLLHLQIFNPKLLLKLVDLQQGLLINITSFRTQLMGPVSTDLEGVSNQLSSISRQISDLSTATHLESLASRSKRILSPIIQDLENHKENLVYHLTALELKINPLLHQVNQSLSHMKAVQYYITNHGSAIAEQNVKMFTSRIENYLEQYQEHIANAINSSATSCQPFWEMYDSFRLLMCRQSIDPLNGFWFATIWCLLSLILITPICLKLVDYYNQTLRESSALSTSESFVNAEDSGDWSNGSPPEADNW